MFAFITPPFGIKLFMLAFWNGLPPPGIPGMPPPGVIGIPPGIIGPPPPGIIPGMPPPCIIPGGIPAPGIIGIPPGAPGIIPGNGGMFGGVMPPFGCICIMLIGCPADIACRIWDSLPNFIVLYGAAIGTFSPYGPLTPGTGGGPMPCPKLARTPPDSGPSLVLMHPLNIPTSKNAAMIRRFMVRVLFRPSQNISPRYTRQADAPNFRQNRKSLTW
jgi:hypothetical protein